MKKLAPCAFCTEKIALEVCFNYLDMVCAAQCYSCGARGPSVDVQYDVEEETEEATKAWNTRVTYHG